MSVSARMGQQPRCSRSPPLGQEQTHTSEQERCREHEAGAGTPHLHSTGMPVWAVTCPAPASKSPGTQLAKLAPMPHP